MSDPLARRRFAEQLCRDRGIVTPRLVDAFAAVPRERFLPPGPWLVRGEADRAARLTADADPQHVYADVSVAIDPARQLFNGAPSVVAPWLDALDLAPGQRVLHVGCGTGYYTAILAEMVGPTGSVVALDVDPDLARAARDNLAAWPNAGVTHGDGSDIGRDPFDAILVHAGVTHPLSAWLDALRPGGRLLLPMTCTVPQMGPLGKGIILLVSAGESGSFSVRPMNLVIVYSAMGVRDDEMNQKLGRAMMGGVPRTAATLRRDPHPETNACWLHGCGFCISA